MFAERRGEACGGGEEAEISLRSRDLQAKVGVVRTFLELLYGGVWEKDTMQEILLFTKLKRGKHVCAVLSCFFSACFGATNQSAAAVDKKSFSRDFRTNTRQAPCFFLGWVVEIGRDVRYYVTESYAFRGLEGKEQKPAWKGFHSFSIVSKVSIVYLADVAKKLG